MGIKRVEYRDNISQNDPEICPPSCTMRYYIDRNNWIDVSVDPRGGLVIRSAHAGIKVLPEASNTIRVEAQHL